MGTLVNGIKEIFATSQSTATHLPVCASDGTPQGRISVGDLASVLGALKAFQSGDFNDKTSNGAFFISGNGGSYSHAPHSNAYPRGVLLVYSLGYTDYVKQVYFECYNPEGAIYERTYGQSVWSKWHEVAVDYPSFYKDYATLAALSTGLGVFKFVKTVGQGEDVLELDTAGWYQTQAYTVAVNLPSGAVTSGVIIVFVLTSNRRFIMYIDANCDVYTNRMWDGNWSTWKKVGS